MRQPSYLAEASGAVLRIVLAESGTFGGRIRGVERRADRPATLPVLSSAIGRNRSASRNAHAERFVRSIREECLNRLILFDERRLIRALDDYVAHDHREPNHQGLSNALITPDRIPTWGTNLRRRERLGGLLPYYHRTA